VKRGEEVGGGHPDTTLRGRVEHVAFTCTGRKRVAEEKRRLPVCKKAGWWGRGKKTATKIDLRPLEKEKQDDTIPPITR